MVMERDYCCVDWGTSTLRLWHLSAQGDVLAEKFSDQGMSRLRPDEFEAVLEKAVQIVAGLVSQRSHHQYRLHQSRYLTRQRPFSFDPPQRLQTGFTGNSTDLSLGLSIPFSAEADFKAELDLRIHDIRSVSIGNRSISSSLNCGFSLCSW